ncbi:rhomboid family intramembrane serine protease [Halobacillus mangrovi]|uniref:rhomboid family intramembrane serine protease n=1 Tax=Halobacillus mangrovi TaxID=402384 RepID=UPI003D966114
MSVRKGEDEMHIDQEYFFWKLIHDLVVVQEFDVLHMNTKDQEVWLEKEYHWKTHVVRLKHNQINWRNELKRDVQITYQQLKQNRQLFRGGKVVLHNLYVSEFPPVDEWEDIKEELKNERFDSYIYYLDDENKEKERSRFYSFFDIEDAILDHKITEFEMESILPYLKQQIVSKHKERKQEAQKAFQFGKPIMTYVLLAINLLAFAYVEWQGSSTSVLTLIEFGAKYNPGIIDGEWWRIVTSMFLHIGLLHLFMNMLALFYLGNAVERIYGSFRFTGIYFLAGIFGGIASFMLNPHVAAGASGAIFGLFGALLYFGVRNRRLFFRTMGWNLLFVIALNIAFGVLVPQVDNGAHMGGLVGGFIASIIFSLPKKKSIAVQSTASIAYLAILAIMINLGLQNVFNGEQTLSQVQETQELNKSGEYEEVISITSQALEEPGSYEAALRFNRSYAYIQIGEKEKAKQDLEVVVEKEPDLAEAYYNLAILHQQNGDKAKAADFAKTAAELNPDNEDFKKLADKLSQ